MKSQNSRFIPAFTHRFIKPGQGLSEYGIILGLVAIVAIPLLVVLGQTSNTQVNAVQSHQTELDQLAGLPGTKTMGNYVINVGPAIPGTQAVELTLQDGSKVNFPNFPTDAGRLVETLGPNGTTDLYNNALRQLGQRLFSEGKITQAEANQFSKLANSGHELASIAKVYDETADQYANNPQQYSSIIKNFSALKDANSSKVKDLDPQLVSLFDLKPQDSNVIFNAQGLVEKGANGDWLRDPQNFHDNTLSPAQVQFLQNYAALERTPALADPAIKALILNLSQNILNVSGSSSFFGNTAAQPEYQFSPQELKIKISDSLHTSSKSICTVGNGRDTGVFCPPINTTG